MNPDYRGDGEFDTTQLRAASYADQVHRDYLAHVLRWGWATREIEQSDVVFDAGCGQDVSLYGVIAGHQSFRPGRNTGRFANDRPRYIGVDLNQIKRKTGAAWAHVRDRFNVVTGDCTSLPFWGDYDRVVSFEVIEHMLPEHGEVYLSKLHESMALDGTLYLSTPVFNGKAAKNHIHEYTIDELGAKLERVGFKIERRWGTFMSWNDMKKVATGPQQELAEELREYFGGDVIASFLAPLYPDYARNNVWVCSK